MTKRGPFKRSTLSTLVDRMVPIENIIDVGVLRATPELISFFPSVKHYLFEPVSQLHQDIRKNYSDIEFELFGIALSDWCGVAKIKTRAMRGGKRVSHASITAKGPDDAYLSAEEVPVATLDSVLADRLGMDNILLKIDVDGQELEVIRGASAVLKRCSVVIVECQRRELVQRIAAVQEQGFELFDLTEPCYFDKAFWQCDAVLVRRDLFGKHFKSVSGSIPAGMYEVFR